MGFAGAGQPNPAHSRAELGGVCAAWFEWTLPLHLLIYTCAAAWAEPAATKGRGQV